MRSQYTATLQKSHLRGILEQHGFPSANALAKELFDNKEAYRINYDNAHSLSSMLYQCISGKRTFPEDLARALRQACDNDSSLNFVPNTRGSYEFRPTAKQLTNVAETMSVAYQQEVYRLLLDALEVDAALSSSDTLEGKVQRLTTFVASEINSD